LQPQGHAQMRIRLFDYHENAQPAVDAPRWQVLEGNEIAIEQGIGKEVIGSLTRKGHRITTNKEFWWYGGAQMIYRLSGKYSVDGTTRSMGYCAASDPRKDGQAVGF